MLLVVAFTVFGNAFKVGHTEREYNGKVVEMVGWNRLLSLNESRAVNSGKEL